MERPDASVCELCAALVAQHLGLRVPSPALIMIDNELVEMVAELESMRSPHHSQVITGSEGLNFGSLFVTNLTTWPVDKGVPVAMRETAANIFAFDALIQNPDRSFKNPNLGSISEGELKDIVIYDHELGFSFLRELFPTLQPWRLDSEHYLNDHVFSRCLRGEHPSEYFIKQLKALSAEVLNGIARQVPEEWQSGCLEPISRHLHLVVQHAEEFAIEVERKLA